MSVKRVNHTAISVSDMTRSIGFYRDLLGLEVLMEMDVDRHAGLDAVVGMSDARGSVAFLGAGDTMIELWCYTSPRGAAVASESIPADLGVRHVAFEVEDLAGLHARLVDAGYRFNSDPVDLGLHFTCYLHGPDGELIELLEDRTDRDMMRRVHERTLARRTKASAGSTSDARRQSTTQE